MIEQEPSTKRRFDMTRALAVDEVVYIGKQLSPDVTSVSRDGGWSVLIGGKVIWIFDDTECFDSELSERRQVSFVSNTASATDPQADVQIVHDFGVVKIGNNRDGNEVRAILDDCAVRTGGWIPFELDEVQFNLEHQGKERLAICEVIQRASQETC